MKKSSVITLFVVSFLTQSYGAWAVVDGTPKEKEELAQLIQQRQALEKETNDALENGVGVYDFDKLLDNTGKIEHKIDEYRKRGVTTYQEDKEDEEFWAGKWDWDDDIQHPFKQKKQGCIHVSDIGVKAITALTINKECKKSNPELCDTLIDGALDIFYKDYSAESAELCLDTITNICLSLSWEPARCESYKKELANSMVFSDKNMDSRFLDFALPEREAKTLIEIAVKKEKPTRDVYCSNRPEQSLSEVYQLNCKLVDGEIFIDRSYVFSESRSVNNIIKEAKKVREQLTRAGNSILWPDKETVIDVLEVGNKANVWGLIIGVNAQECNKYNDLIKNYFGGYAKMEPVAGDDGASKDDKMICVTQWYPSPIKRRTINRDFDKRGFGTNYANFIRREKVEDVQFLIDYLKNSAEQSGKELTKIHCDNTQGIYKNVKFSGLLSKTHVLDTDKAYFLRCYGTYNGKELVEDFLFKLRESTTHIRKLGDKSFTVVK